MMIRAEAQLKNVELGLKPNSEQKVENIFVPAILPNRLLYAVFRQ
jgi:hypothetical protein